MLPVSAIVLAAGQSSRFGVGNKLLRPWGSTTVVGSVVDALRKSGLRTIVVLGRDANEVRGAVLPAETVFNCNYVQGMGGSIAEGARVAPPGGVLIALGDMPGLSQEVISAIRSSYESANQIVVPVYDSDPQRHGHPVLFGATYRAELASLGGDIGAREIIRAHSRAVVRIPVPGSLTDIDTPADLGP